MNPSAARFHHIGHLDPDPSWHRAPHAHDLHELIVILSGRLRVRIRGQEFDGGPGEVFFYPSHTPHEEWSNPRAPVESLFLAFAWPGRRDPLPLRQTDLQGRVGLLARWLHGDREANPAARPAVANAFLHAILAELLRLGSGDTDPMVLRVRSHMRQHLEGAVTLGHLAGCAGISKFHFVRRYRSLTGRTPMQDLRHLRLLAARDLLLTTSLPLKEIAPRSGLGDAYHLSRLFRQHFKTSPGRLRHRSGRPGKPSRP
jgi:AraC-like DNA-binding protein